MTGALGINAVILAGRGVPKPLAAAFVRLIESIEVHEVADGQSGFRITFAAARTADDRGPDYSVLTAGTLALFNRVTVLVVSGLSPTVLFDGVVTDHWLDPADGTDKSRLVVSGADASAMMDLEEKTVAHPGQSEAMIAAKLILRYARFNLVPRVVRPKGMQTPLATERVPMQRGTDLDHLYLMAGRFGYVFAIRAGLPSVAYWGPPQRSGRIRRALSAAFGTYANVDSITFTQDGQAATTAGGFIQDPARNQRRSINVRKPDLPPLARRSGFRAANLRKTLLSGADGLTSAQATALAQGVVNQSATDVVRARGELDALAYGDFLRAADRVGVRGAGNTFDGLYAVDSVTHVLRLGEYRQQFSLSREGTGSRQPLVRA